MTTWGTTTFVFNASVIENSCTTDNPSLFLRIAFTDGTTRDYGGAVDTVCDSQYAKKLGVTYPGYRSKRIKGFTAMLSGQLLHGTTTGTPFVRNPLT